MANETRLCILLVEAHDDGLRVMTLLLERSEYIVQAAHDCDKSLQLIQDGKCDLLISDVKPGEQSGLDLMGELKRRIGLKGIAISAYTSEADKANALDAGFDRFLQKPFEFSQLLAAILAATQPSAAILSTARYNLNMKSPQADEI